MDALKNLLWVVGLIGLMFLSSYFGWRAGVSQGGKASFHSDTSYVTVVDTVTFYQPIPRDSVVVRYVTRVLKVAEPDYDASGTVAIDTLCVETAENQLVGDSVLVKVPITQKVYSDSSYTAYVSGYETNLDSIFIRHKEVTMTIVKTETIEQKKFRRWNVGIIGGYGYGFLSKQFEPFIGVGVTVSLF